MEKIKKVFREDFGRYVQGTNFVKGDYIPRERKYFAKTDNNKIVELSPQLIRAAIVGGVYITRKVLSSLIGRSVDDFRKR